MAKKIYQAVCPDGSIFNRTTDREYVAAVVGQISFDNALAVADQDGKYDGSNWEFACQMVAWGGLYKGERRDWYTDEQIAQELAKYQARMNEYPNAAAAIAGERAKRVDAVNAAKAKGFYEEWQLIGFCGRPDLAAKTASKSQGAYYSDVRIVPAVLKG